MSHSRQYSASEPLLGEGISYSSYARSKSISSISSIDNAINEEEQIKNKLKWYFKNPYQKYKDRGRKPVKLILQIIKIVLVTVQVTLFAVDEFSVVQFNTDNIETFRNLFLVDYTGQRYHELFTKKQIYEHIFFTWQQYYNFNHIMIGSYELQDQNKTYPPMVLCIDSNGKSRGALKRDKNFNGFSRSEDGYYIVDKSESAENACHKLKPPDGLANETLLQDFIRGNNLTSNFQWILSLTLKFSFTMNYTVVHRTNSPDCYKFDLKVIFDNSDLDGIMKVRLESDVDFHICRQNSGKLHIREYNSTKILWTVFDLFIIIICVFSFILCVRSFKRHFKLSQDVGKFFTEFRHERFTLSDRLNFLSFWLMLITLSDICSTCGSIIKLLVDWLERPELYTSCSLFFGMAALFSWIGILRYLGFMQGYNTLLVTLKTAFPTMIRFVFCVSFIYLGFTVCGWIMFGPYHEKFRNLFVTSECLFALINGDDMFTTFSEMDDSDSLIWYFSKIYLYTFISLFIFVVLSLFIGIMADTYERIKDYGHAPKSRMELFMEGKEYHAGGEQQHRHGTNMCSHRGGENFTGVERGDDDDPNALTA
ncbi:mucolipin-3-like [Hydractinia symbiolongicarpus]|uniref:mucolipin-3-like n=1 Tax=Hydractinia symbiolongicarpus TaxID=13093 RepID=UPI00254EC212|nr:mucolipin-3-like [Hydractinia symbiolongicarpus]